MSFRFIQSKITRYSDLDARARIGYRDVYVLNLQLAAGFTHKLYFGSSDASAGAVEIYLDDGREVDGNQFPFSIGESRETNAEPSGASSRMSRSAQRPPHNWP